MSNIVDLDILFKRDIKKVSFTTKDGQSFQNLELKISTRIALESIRLYKDGTDELESTAYILALMIKEQFKKDITSEWIIDNIEPEYLIYISSYITDGIENAKNIIQREKSGTPAKKK